VNQSGEFNSPFGKYKNPKFCLDLSEYVSILKNWQFSCKDFSELEINDEDFLFCDPPYASSFVGYGANGFTWDDQLRLVKWLSSHPGPVVLCNSATDQIIQLYTESGYELFIIDARRSISCNGNRKPAKEVIATRNL
jgi:DNA adenine methylase